MNSDCFMCARLTEATAAAEARAEKAEAGQRAARSEVKRQHTNRHAAAGDVRRAALDALRALLLPPFLVVPYVYRPRARPAPTDRFALLELE